MKLSEMRKRVLSIIDSRTYEPEEIDIYLNQALDYCLGVTDVPEFKRVFTVTTSTTKGYISLADQIENYGGRLRRVKYNGADLHIYSTMEEMLDNYDTLEESGDIESVAIEGRNLWYAKVPETAVNLLILCYISPEPLSKSNPELTWMQPDCHNKILVNGACYFLFDQIEEEDSNKPMMRHYRGAMNSGIIDFKGWISRNRKNVSYSSWRY